MSLIKKFGIAGAVFGASMAFAGTASAVSVSGTFSDDFSNDTVADGGTFNLDNTGLASFTSTSTGLTPGGISPLPGGPGQFWFEFKNTSATNLYFRASVNDTPNGFIDGFTLTWKNAALQDLESYTVGLPAPFGTTLNITAAVDSIYYLVATWTGATSADNGGGSYTAPELIFKVTTFVSLEAPSEVPIPPSLVLFGSGLLGLGFLSARRRKKVASV